MAIERVFDRGREYEKYTTVNARWLLTDAELDIAILLEVAPPRLLSPARERVADERTEC